MGRYALAEHVFVCVDGDHLVLLDLKKDRYWALEAARTAGLGPLVSGWPVGRAVDPSGADDEQSAPSDPTEVVGVLRARGLLAESIPPGKDATPVHVDTPGEELLEAGGLVCAARTGSWFAFLAASVFAKFALRTWPFERVIHRVRRRKAAHSEQAGKLDAQRARALVETFVRHRVFLFSAAHECLHDSLALLEFLARYGIYPDWVFAVQTRPFAAHCWIQQGGMVFNDTVEHVTGYTPIMFV